MTIPVSATGGQGYALLPTAWASLCCPATTHFTSVSQPTNLRDRLRQAIAVVKRPHRGLKVARIAEAFD